MQALDKCLGFVRRQPRWRWIGLGLLILGVVGVVFWTHGSKASGKSPLFTARRGALEINVLEG